jgi:hypothetical protein
MSFTEIVGRLWEKDTSSFLAKVPLTITTIPEVPEVVTIGVGTYILMKSDQLEYRRVTPAKVTALYPVAEDVVNEKQKYEHTRAGICQCDECTGRGSSVGRAADL